MISGGGGGGALPRFGPDVKYPFSSRITVVRKTSKEEQKPFLFYRVINKDGYNILVAPYLNKSTKQTHNSYFKPVSHD